MKTITSAQLTALFHKIAGLNESAYGEFDFKGIRILVKKSKTMLGQERSKRLYDTRRARGLCVHCGAKVRNRNPHSGRLYRLCETHRLQELRRKLAQRRAAS